MDQPVRKERRMNDKEMQNKEDKPFPCPCRLFWVWESFKVMSMISLVYLLVVFTLVLSFCVVTGLT